jgi:hypothetical protein
VSFGEVALGIFGLFLLIDRIDRLEYLIFKTLESVAVLGVVLSLGAENANAIHEAFKFTWPVPILLVVSQPFDRVDRMIHFPLLLMALGRSRLVCVARLILLLLLSGVASSTRAYLLAVANISFDVMGFFMVSLWIKDESLSPFLKNITMDLPSTSGMMFVFLQNGWLNSRRDSPFFWTMLVGPS